MTMKKWCLFLCAYFSLCLLAACAGNEQATPEDPPPEETAETTVTCRVISELSGGTLILAEQGSHNGLYTLSPADQSITLDGMDFDPSEPGAYQALPGGSLAGTTVAVTFDGGVQESWPMGFDRVTALAFSTENFDDTGRLYLDVLEDLWEADSGLNENISELGVDLSATSLSGSEREAVAYAFGAAHGFLAMETTYDELMADGYLAPVSVSTPAGEGDTAFYQWEDGCLFSITERDEPVVFNEAAMGPMTTGGTHEGIRFDAQKWRGPLAAYSFYNCTAARTAGGPWGDYTPEAEMIS